MPSQVTTRRAMFTVQAASWVVRIIAFTDMIAGVLGMFLRKDMGMFLHGVDEVSITLMLIGLVALVHPLILPCLYSRKPEISNRCFQRNCVVVVWFFLLHPAYGLLVLGGFVYVAVSRDFLYILVMVTCFMLLIVNICTFYILKNNGCCFVYTPKKDVEKADMSTNIGLAATSFEYIHSHVPEVSFPSPPPYTVSVLPGERLSTFAAGKGPGKSF